MKQKSLLYLCLVLLFASCATKKDLTYFRDAFSNSSAVTTATLASVVEPIIQVDDQLLITVTALEPEGAAPFNLSYIIQPVKSDMTLSNAVSGSAVSTLLPDWPTMQYYQVDIKGDIEFPMLGTLHVAGMKKSKLHQLLSTRLETLLKDPVITIRFVNYRVTVLGAVARPGVYVPQGECITILEALGLAGDITCGKANEVLVIREKAGKMETTRVNLQSSDLFASPCFYLQQNDVVYVAPR